VASNITMEPVEVVHLSGKKVVPIDCPEGVWVLDTGASNHMIGC
jgi:hypothetical protein